MVRRHSCFPLSAAAPVDMVVGRNHAAPLTQQPRVAGCNCSQTRLQCNTAVCSNRLVATIVSKKAKCRLENSPPAAHPSRWNPLDIWDSTAWLAASGYKEAALGTHSSGAHHLPSPTRWYPETEVTQARDANLFGEYGAFSMTKASTAPLRSQRYQ